MAMMFLLTRIFTSKEVNINCVYNLCGEYSLMISDKIYPVLWFIAGFLMIYITYIILSDKKG
ncbi:hypothetical protein HYW74_00840 [Candidatus Pacearchaeota archaeon]|nr:hypothetical protein [Candidatus Pacearchaeota archaeon]